MRKKFPVLVLLGVLFFDAAAALAAEPKTTSSFFRRSRKTQEVKKEAESPPPPPPPVVEQVPEPEKPVEERMVTEGITLTEVRKQGLAEPPPPVHDPALYDPQAELPRVPGAPAALPGANKGYLVGAPEPPKLQTPPPIPKVPSAPKTPPLPGKKTY